MSPGPRRLLATLTLGAAFALHASLYSHWLVDDAGISIAYARNWAAGHGLVSQPGMPPVEGYSNPGWVVLLAALSRAGLLTIPGAVKALSLTLVTLGLWLLLGLSQHAGGSLGPGCWAGLFLAANPAVVIWCTSGLENPLYLAGLLWLADRGAAWLGAERDDAVDRAAIGAGLAAGLVAWTRPDGLADVLVLPVLVAVRARRGREPRGIRPHVATVCGLLAVGFVARYWTFGAWQPNTYLAKGGPGPREVLELLLLAPPALLRSQELSRTLLHPGLGNLFALLVGLGTLGALRGGRMRAPLATVLGFAASTLAAYLLLPGDWMGEVRFATGFFPFFYLGGFLVLDDVLRGLPPPARTRLSGALAAALLLASAPAFATRAVRFSLQPTISLDFVTRAFAERFDRWAAELGVEGGSVLLVDLGGMLLESDLRVHDLAGLCDPVIAASLGEDLPRLHQYVLGELRPTFVLANPKWAARARLADDPRFERDYVPIVEAGDWPGFPTGTGAGTWLRRDVAEERPEVVEALRAEPQGWKAYWEPAPPNRLRELLRSLAGKVRLTEAPGAGGPAREVASD